MDTFRTDITTAIMAMVRITGEVPTADMVGATRIMDTGLVMDWATASDLVGSDIMVVMATAATDIVSVTGTDLTDMVIA